MNGDIGKFPSGAVYPTTPESLATPASTSTDYSSLNGVAEPLEPYAQTSTVPGGSPADPNATGPDIPLDELKQMLSSQLEYYFSRENLANDAYLLSQMDNDQYVPIWTIANFNQVKKLTKDINLITEVLRESPNVQVDEEGIKVRPNHKRCIVILREIPDNTPIEDVKALFSGEGCPKLISCEFAHNNSWYVTFESDEDAQRAYRFLREEVREFQKTFFGSSYRHHKIAPWTAKLLQITDPASWTIADDGDKPSPKHVQGKPIMARIKAKPMNRLPIPPVPALGAAMKNGYRAPHAAVYDPNTYQSQQRFVYTNGNSIPPTVNYGNQVHVYTFQQQPPFYPPSMIQAAWTPASPAYFDIGSVFSVNGLAPQGSFSKPQNSRYVPRRNKRNQPMDRGSVTDAGTGLSRQSYHVGVATNIVGAGMVASKSANSNSTSSKVAQPQQAQQTVQPSQTQTAQQQQQQQQQPSANVEDHSKSHHTNTASASQESSDVCGTGPSQNTSGSTLRSDGEDNSFRQSREVLANKEPMPPRHRRRRKEDEVVGTGRQQTMKSMSGGSPQPLNRDIPGAKGVQFDLEATAFPPLPGLDGGSVVSAKSAPPVETVQIETSSSHWENRLSDVVKGTAKAKSTNTKEKESSGAISTSPRAASPASPSPKPVTTTPVSAGTAAVVPEVKVQQPPPPLLPLPAQSTSQSLPTSSSVEKEVKDVGTNSDMGPSLVSQTPPSSPDKTVPVAKCMADKATKTDDTLLNGEMVGVSGIGKANEMGGGKQHSQQQQPAAASVPTSVSKPVPTTTNAATMTSAVVVTDVTPASVRIMVATTTNTSSAVTAAPAAGNPAPSDSCPTVETAGGPTRLSYAQVAQHTKEKVEKSARDKQSSAEQEKEKEKDRKKEMNTRIMQPHGDIRDPPQREFRDGPVRYMGRGGPRPVYDRERTDRGGIRRRDGPDRVPRFREFLRPRSPK